MALEKSLLQMNLSKGLNERDQQELIDVASGLTVVENMLQDSTGAWVKRPGLTALETSGYDTDAAVIADTRAVLRTVSGLGLVGGGNLYLFLEEGSKWRNAGQTSEVSLTSDTIDSTGNIYTNAYSGARVIASCSSTKYDVVIHEGPLYSSTATQYQQSIVTIQDRVSGVVYKKYPLRVTAGAAGIINARCAFVGDRYLHIWWHGSVGAADAYVAQIDTDSTLPSVTSFLASKTVALTAGGAASVLYDIAVTSDRTITVWDSGAGGANPGKVISFTTASALASQAEPLIHKSCSAANGVLWCTSSGVAGRIQVTGYDATDITLAALYDWQDPTFAVTGYEAIVAKPDGSIGIARMSTAAGCTVLILALSTAVPTVEYFTVADPTVTTSLTWSITRDAIIGWYMCSRPFYCSTSGKVYCHLNKATVSAVAPAAGVPSAHVVVCLDDLKTLEEYNGASAVSVYRVRPVALLEGFNGYAVNVKPPLGAATASTGGPMLRYLSTVANEFTACVPVQATARSAAFAVHRMRFRTSQSHQADRFGGETYMSAGLMQCSDGMRVREASFVDSPIISATTVSVGGALTASATYQYIAVFRFTSKTGAVSYSRVSNIQSATTTVGNKTVAMTITPPSVCWMDGGPDDDGTQTAIDVYRTIGTSGTVFYLVASTEIGSPTSNIYRLSWATTGVATFTDAGAPTTDAVVATNPLLYRQPGTAGTELDRFPPPGGSTIICSHKDRLFCVDSYGQRVYYSSFYVDGESAWFNSQFTMFAHGGSGPITGLASMDGKLFIFKRDAVFAVDGDGPPENGGNGSEFSPATKLAAPYGALDQRSIIVTTAGIMFMSVRGIELLSRSMDLKWIGDRVQNTTAAYPVCTGVAQDTIGRVRFLLAAAEPDATGNAGGQDGREVIYDLPADCWSTAKHTPYQGAGTAYQSICTYNHDGTERTVYCDTDANIVRLNTSTARDRATLYPVAVLETGWLKTGAQARQRLWDAFALVKQRSGKSALKMSVYFNYETSATQTFTWEPSTFPAGPVMDFNINLAKQDVFAVKVRIEDAVPADTGTYPPDVFQGFDFLGLAFKVGLKPNQGPVLPVAQKG